MNRFKNFICTCFLISGLLSFSVSWAQTAANLFTVISPSTLLEEQQTVYEKLQQESTYDTSYFVNVAFIKDIQSGGTITLQMPGMSCQALVKAKQIESHSNGDYYWYGEVQKEDGETEEECACYDGNVSIYSISGRVFGSITIDERDWTLHDLGYESNINVLVERVYSEIAVPECGTTDEGENPVSGTPLQYRSGNCPVRVTAVYTPETLNKFPDISSRIITYIQDANQSLRNSKIDQGELTFFLEGIQEFEFGEGADIELDLESLIANSDLQQIRNGATADIVLVYAFSEKKYGLAGLAGGIFALQDRAYAIVDMSRNFNLTTAHELAHLFGCRHELADDSNGEYEHGYFFKTGCWPNRTQRQTIMHTLNTDRRIKHYSNPEVYYKANATGTEEDEHNARMLRENACSVAEHRTDDVASTFRALISSEHIVCPCNFVTFTADGIGGGPGNYTFEWFTSADGFNYGNVEGVGNVFALNAPCTPGANLHIKVVGTSADNQVDDAFSYISVLSEPNDCDANTRSGFFTTRQAHSVQLLNNPVIDSCY